MRITYDPKYDLLYIKLGEAEKVSCKEVYDDITFDVDEMGRLVGIEVLSASEHLDLNSVLPVEVVRGSIKTKIVNF